MMTPRVFRFPYAVRARFSIMTGYAVALFASIIVNQCGFKKKSFLFFFPPSSLHFFLCALAEVSYKPLLLWPLQIKLGEGYQGK